MALTRHPQTHIDLERSVVDGGAARQDQGDTWELSGAHRPPAHCVRIA
jgi:hypothetical protein